MSIKSVRESRQDKVFDVINNMIMAIVLIVMLYPIIIVISSSFSSPYALMAGKVWLFPVDFTLEGYRAIFSQEQVWNGMLNSTFYTIAGTSINMILSVLAAYPLSRKDFSIGTLMALVFAFTMWFNGGLIPTYLLVRDLGMFNTRWAMLLPTAMTVWNMIIIRTYFQNNISGELLESAKIDGCNDFKYLLRIAIPLSKPVLAVVCLYYMVANWNSFFNAYLYLQDKKMFPIQVVLREILLLGNVSELTNNAAAESDAQLMNELLKYALVIVASLPMILFYPLVQKYFVQGIMVGAVKG